MLRRQKTEIKTNSDDEGVILMVPNWKDFDMAFFWNVYEDLGPRNTAELEKKMKIFIIIRRKSADFFEISWFLGDSVSHLGV